MRRGEINNGSSLNRYLIEDLECRLRVPDLLDWIEEQAEQLSTLGTTSAGHIEFVKALLNERGIDGIFEQDIVGYAHIKPSREGRYEIYYNRKLDSRRWRFSVGHEIGHTYWFAPGGGAKPLSPVQLNLGGDPTIEYLCDRFALALLLPRVQISSQLSWRTNHRNKPSLQMIPDISVKFRVAEKYVARRLFFDLSQDSEALVGLELPSAKEGGEAGATWKVSWLTFGGLEYGTSATRGTAISIKKGRSIPTEMLPDIPEGVTSQITLDGRWWEGLRKKPLKKRHPPFRHLPVLEGRKAYAYRSGNRTYIAFPRESFEAEVRSSTLE